MMGLNVNNFFTNYIVHPFSRDLTLEQQTIAFVLSLLLGCCTLGITHIVGVSLYNRKVQRCCANLVPGHHRNFQKILNKTHGVGMKILGPASSQEQGFTLSQDQVSTFLQQEMIEPFYSKKFPPKSEITVPFRSGKSWDKVHWVKWVSLSKKEKIELNNHFAPAHSKIGKNIVNEVLIDFYLLGEGVFGDYLKGDPRKIHGSDHCCRVAIFAAAFAYLYNKYHPKYQVSMGEILLTQLVGAGHDSGRQSDGNDYYDLSSAENTVNALKKAGITDECILKEAYDAIANKDSKDLKSKSLIAKCVQNADSVDFARLSLDTPKQSKSKFNTSRGYLDIFNEMQTLANGDPKAVLKNGMTYEDFLEELDSLRSEMNMFIYSTHKKKARKIFSQDNGNYYNQVTSRINGIEYPLLQQVLEDCGIAKPMKERGKSEEETFEATKPTEVQKLEGIGQIPASTFDDFIFGLEKVKTPQDADLLVAQAKFDLEQYKTAHQEHPDVYLLTSASSALEEACRLYIQNDRREEAKQALQIAANDIPVESEYLGLDFDEMTQGTDDPIFINRGCDQTRKRRLRLSKKTIDGNEVTEISFELTSLARKSMNSILPLLAGDPDVQISTVKSRFPKKNESDGKYYHKLEGKDVGVEVNFLWMGSDKKITFNDLGVEILIGNEEKLWNQYHLVRVFLSNGSDSKSCHKALARIGLPTLLMKSRPQDILKEALAKLLTIRFPKTVYVYQNKHGYKDIENIYQQLNDAEKELIKSDLQKMQLTSVNRNHAEWINPIFAEEARKEGARALAFFLQGGDIESSSHLAAKIIKTGLLSSQERFQRGIIGGGNVPTFNNIFGSSNQVFTRTLPQKWFENKVNINSFSILGPVMMLFDVKAYERMPYTYLRDYTGLRNPSVKIPCFCPIPDTPELGLTGRRVLGNRPAFPDYIRELVKKVRITTETMFDLSLGPQYLKKLVVMQEKDKYVLWKILFDHGIQDINGTPLDEAIIFSNTLTLEMIEGEGKNKF